VLRVCALPAAGDKGQGGCAAESSRPAHKAWHEVPAADIPGKQVLVTSKHLGNDANGAAIPRHTPELPRVGLTTYPLATLPTVWSQPASSLSTVSSHASLLSVEMPIGHCFPCFNHNSRCWQCLCVTNLQVALLRTKSNFA
jgi:hypothetical protein